MSQVDVAILVGSLRKDSLSRKVARALPSLAPAALRCAEVEIERVAKIRRGAPA